MLEIAGFILKEHGQSIVKLVWLCLAVQSIIKLTKMIVRCVRARYESWLNGIDH